MSHVVYLTGSSGFIGQMIVRTADSDRKISKIYCPIRAKYGSSGEERFKQLFPESKKARFVDSKVDIPEDTTIVILNAYSVKFLTPLVKILKDNVSPMMDHLDQCKKPGMKIKGISIVSTAYVQLPLPYKRDPKNRIEFVLRDHGSASKIMDDLKNGSTTEENIMSLLNDNAKQHFKTNNYALSKHIMEHVIHENYGDLPICIVRPSIVAPSRDGLHGHGVKSGFSLFMDIARSPVMRFPRNEGTLDLVYVEDVSKDILRGAMDLATRAVPKSDTGNLFHPVLSSTSFCGLDPVKCFRIGSSVRRYDIRNETLRNMFRAVEIGAVRLLAGKKKAGLVRSIYTNFDPVMKNTWDYEDSHSFLNLEDMTEKYYKKREELVGESTSNKEKGWRWMQNDNFVVLFLVASLFMNKLDNFPELQLVRLFVLLRLLVLLGMQALFYGNTPFRNEFPYTINDKPYDVRQHDREETSWPSILASGLEVFAACRLGLLPDPSTMPFFSWTSIRLLFLTHALPVEFIYYWGHRWMHQIPMLSKIHRHHHLSIVPTPKSSVTFLLSEHIFYDLLFALPILVPAYFGHATVVSTLFYIPFFDFCNTLGHTNLEVFPSWYMDSPFFYFFYCTTYHHVHHKYFRYNYALFMPIYDIMFGTYSKKYTENDFEAAKRTSITTVQGANSVSFPNPHSKCTFFFSK